MQSFLLNVQIRSQSMRKREAALYLSHLVTHWNDRMLQLDHIFVHQSANRNGRKKNEKKSKLVSRCIKMSFLFERKNTNDQFGVTITIKWLIQCTSHFVCHLSAFINGTFHIFMFQFGDFPFVRSIVFSLIQLFLFRQKIGLIWLQ